MRWPVWGLVILLSILLSGCSSKQSSEPEPVFNPLPRIVSTPDSTIAPGETFVYRVAVEDDDDDAHTFFLIEAPSGMVVSSEGMITWTPPLGVSSSGLVTVAAIDDDGNTALQAFEVRIQLQPLLPLPSMVPLPSGSFQQGDQQFPTLGDRDERPVRQVTLSAFSMSTYEITIGEFAGILQWALDPYGSGAPGDALIRLDPADDPRLVVNTQGSERVLLALYPSTAPITWDGTAFVTRDDPDKPMVQVTWYGAAFFCWALNQRSSAQQTLSLSTWSFNPAALGFRLPTESEWEYAARGGVSGAIYPWGNTDPDLLAIAPANYRSVGDSIVAGAPPQTRPVGSYAATGFGLHDIAGNVAHWCLDWYQRDIYDTMPMVIDPIGPASGLERCVRGGSWADDPYHLRNANRDQQIPSAGSDAIGFRVVLRGSASLDG